MVDTSAWEDLNLHPLIHKALGINGFSKPMPIQSRAITAAVQKRKDVLGAAQTGSGKTLAFGLPIIQVSHCPVVHMYCHNFLVCSGFCAHSWEFMHF